MTAGNNNSYDLVVIGSGPAGHQAPGIDGSPGHRMTSFPSDFTQAFQFSPDGKTLGVMRTHSESDVVLIHDEGPSPR